MERNEFQKRYMRQFGYSLRNKGLNEMNRVWEIQKTNLLEHFRLDPNWNEDAKAIIIPHTEFEAKFSNKAIKTFRSWVRENIQNFQIEKSTEDYSDVYYVNKLDDIRVMVRYAERNNKKVEVDGKDITEIREEISTEYRDFQVRIENLYRIKTENEKAKYVTKEFRDKVTKVVGAVEHISDYATERNMTESLANEVNAIYPINAVAGQKVSRVINKLFNEIGFTQYTKKVMQENPDGSEREVDDGYQHNFNKMAMELVDGKYKRYVVLSLNPIDFWGMSIMDGVTSCMSVDKYNLSGLSAHEYAGAYSGGTESYMLDSSSFVFYTITDDYTGTEPCKIRKKERCIFAVSENGSVIMQSRVYPDGRDNGDDTKAGQYRAIVQEIISRVWGRENKWIIKKGPAYCRDWTSTNGTHYADYNSCGDCNISYLQDESIQRKRINIGAEQICPVCGKKHQYSSNVICRECEPSFFKKEFVKEFDEDFDYIDLTESNSNIPVNVQIPRDESDAERYCDQCGERIDNESYIEIDGHYFCDEDCASDYGYHMIGGTWCNESDDDIVETDNGWQYRQDCYEDEYDHNWYYGEPEVITEDNGYEYASEENAERDGNLCDHNGDWYNEDDMYWVEAYGEYYHVNELIWCGDDYFVSESDANEAGYVQTENDEWVNRDDAFYDEYEDVYFLEGEEDVITVDGTRFYTEDSARQAGWVKTMNDEWILQENAFFDDWSNEYFKEEDAEVTTVDGEFFLYETSAIIAGYRETEEGWVKQESERESA